MAVTATHPIVGKTSKPDLRSLRETIDWLRREGLLLETDVEVNGDLELTGIQKTLDGSLPILFNRVTGYPHARAITNCFANIDIVNRMFGWEDSKDRTRKLAQALTHPIKPELIPSSEQAPCQEEVITDDLDVNKYIMAIRHTHLETEVTIGSGCSVLAGDYFHGGSHIGYNRMNFRWGNVGTFQSSPGSHMWQVITEHYRDALGIPQPRPSLPAADSITSSSPAARMSWAQRAPRKGIRSAW
jgi:4-hydroxy-3-polyprenylbenzoate decarboxylase